MINPYPTILEQKLSRPYAKRDKRKSKLKVEMPTPGEVTAHRRYLRQQKLLAKLKGLTKK